METGSAGGQMSAHTAERKKLAKRLKGFCVAIGDELKNLDPALISRITEMRRRLDKSLVVSITGLSGSEHYAIADFLLGTSLFDSCPEGREGAIIKVRHGEIPRTIVRSGDATRQVKGAQVSLAYDEEMPDEVIIELPIAILSQIGFDVFPAYDSGVDRSKYLADLASDSDIVMWSTSAANPWQASERRLWFTVPEELKRYSILAISGAGQLDASQAEQTATKAHDIVGDEFNYLALIDVPGARAAVPEGKVKDGEKFAASGGRGLLANLLALLKLQQETLIVDAGDLRAELDRIPLGNAQAPAPLPIEPMPALLPSDPIRASICKGIDRCKDTLADGDSGFERFFEEVDAVLHGLGGNVRKGVLGTKCGVEMTRTLMEAHEFIELLKFERSQKSMMDGALALRQVCTEFLSHYERQSEDALPASLAG